jgi:hypothetical protein
MSAFSGPNVSGRFGCELFDRTSRMSHWVIGLLHLEKDNKWGGCPASECHFGLGTAPDGLVAEQSKKFESLRGHQTVFPEIEIRPSGAL